MLTERLSFPWSSKEKKMSVHCQNGAKKGLLCKATAPFAFLEETLCLPRAGPPPGQVVDVNLGQGHKKEGRKRTLLRPIPCLCWMRTWLGRLHFFHSTPSAKQKCHKPFPFFHHDHFHPDCLPFSWRSNEIPRATKITAQKKRVSPMGQKQERDMPSPKHTAHRHLPW